MSQITHATLDKESLREESVKEPSSESSLESSPTPGKDDEVDGYTNLSIKKIIELFVAEKFISFDSPVGQQSVREFCENYGLETVMEMLKAAVGNKARTLSYIEKGLAKNAADKAEKAERARIHAEIAAYKASEEHRQQVREHSQAIPVPPYATLKDWRELKDYRHNGLDAICDACVKFLEKYPDHSETTNVREALETYKRERREEDLKMVPIPTGKHLEDATYMAKWAEKYPDHPQLEDILRQSKDALENRAKRLEIRNAEIAEHDRQETETRMLTLIRNLLNQVREPGIKVTQRDSCAKLIRWVEENPNHEWAENARQATAEFKKRLATNHKMESMR